MSRFTTTSATGERYVYGYDRPLQYYFLDKITKSGDGFPEYTSIVGELSDPPIYGSALNLLDKIDELKIDIPELHRLDLHLDLPLSPLSEVSK